MVQNKSSAAPTSVEKPIVMRDAKPTEIRATVALAGSTVARCAHEVSEVAAPTQRPSQKPR